jgi:hypothetical protein
MAWEVPIPVAQCAKPVPKPVIQERFNIICNIRCARDWQLLQAFAEGNSAELTTEKRRFAVCNRSATFDLPEDEPDVCGNLLGGLVALPVFLVHLVTDGA